jgi:hypothetical protein
MVRLSVVRKVVTQSHGRGTEDRNLLGQLGTAIREMAPSRPQFNFPPVTEKL